MALSDEEKKLLAELQQRENEPDEDDFDIEIWDSEGAGARVPYRKGKTWLQRFGIDVPEAPVKEEGKPPAKAKKGDGDQGETRERPTQRYFSGGRG